MSQRITITTPEGVHLEYALAGLGSRFLALLLDSIIQMGILAVVALVTFFTLAAARGILGDQRWWIIAAVGLVLFLLMDAYFVLFEGLWNGQTPGKRMLGLRVIREGGYPLDFRGALIRNLLRIVDFLPGMYGVGVCFVLFHPEARRVGDLTAGTLVVKEGEAIHAGTTGFTWESNAPVEMPIALDGITEQHLQLIETFLRRRAEMEPGLRWTMGEQIGAQLRQIVPLEGAAVQWPSERLMEEIVRARARRAGL